MVLATTEPWPDLENCLAALTPQVRELGGEILVGDGEGRALDPQRVAQSPWLTWIRRPGASVFALRAEGTRRALGEIVAITEDHCVMSSDWCGTILTAFERHPDALAVSGPVLNGSRDHLIDWANYLHTFAATLPPYSAEQLARVPPPANVALRRSALEEDPADHPEGWLELELIPRLHREGRLIRDESMVLTHVQSHGFWKTLQAHYHNGRSTTGLGRARFSRERLPWKLYRRVARSFGTAADYRSIIRKTRPLVFLLSCCHSLGELVGTVAGPGQSPARLR